MPAGIKGSKAARKDDPFCLSWANFCFVLQVWFRIFISDSYCASPGVLGSPHLYAILLVSSVEQYRWGYLALFEGCTWSVSITSFRCHPDYTEQVVLRDSFAKNWVKFDGGGEKKKKVLQQHRNRLQLCVPDYHNSQECTRDLRLMCQTQGPPCHFMWSARASKVYDGLQISACCLKACIDHKLRLA